MAPVSAC